MNRVLCSACVSSKQGSDSKQYVGTMNTKCGSISTYLFFPAVCHSCVSRSPPSSVRFGSYGATAAAFQGIPFVAATNGIFFGCACLCVLLYVILNTMLTIATHTSSEFKSTRAAHKHPNSNERCNKQRTLHRLMYLTSCLLCVRRNTCVPPFNLRHPRDFKSTKSRRGTLNDVI